MSKVDHASFLSQSFMFWAYSLIRKSSKTNPTFSDLDEIPDVISFTKLFQKLENLWDHELKTQKSPSLLKVLLKANGRDMIKSIAPICISTLGYLLQAVLIKWMLEYLQDSSIELWKGVVYAIAFGIISIIMSTQLARGLFFLSLYAGRTKGACSLMIFNHTLKLAQSSINSGAAAGKLLNNVGSDLELLESLAVFGFLSTGPLFIIGSIILIYFLLGIAGIFGILVSLLYIPLNFWVGAFVTKYRMTIGKFSDSRIKLISNLIEGIRVIKLYGWEFPFIDITKGYRAKEIKQYRIKARYQTLTKSSTVCGQGLVLLVTFTIHSALGNEIHLSSAFAAISLLLVTHNIITQNLSLAIEYIYLLLAVCRRLAQSLKLKTINSKIYPAPDNLAVKFNDASFSWQDSPIPVPLETQSYLLETESSSVLRNITMDIYHGELVIVVGKVGAGKTTFLMSILNEISKTGGFIGVNGTLAYTDQESWVISETIKENILMGKDYDEELYNSVVKSCCLDEDIKTFKHGSETMVGEKGVTLSGGQKARITLARAVYSQRDIYLLDDPLSAVDSEVSQKLFKNCIKGILEGKTRILVTHQIYVLPEADKILIFDDGNVLFCGAYNQLLAREDLKEIYGELFDSKKKNKGHQDSDSEEENNEIKETKDTQTIQEEEKAEGSVPISFYWKYLQSGFKNSSVLFFLFLLSFAAIQVILLIITYWVAYWSNQSDQSSWFYPVIMAIMVAIFYVFGIGRIFVLYECIYNSNEIYHNNSLKTLLQTNTHYFDSNPSGRIINRFSKDIAVMDEPLTFYFPYVFQYSCVILANLVVIMIVNPVNIAFVFILAILLTLLFKKVVPSARNFKRLELISRSPVFNFFTNAINGLASIRAYELQNHLKSQLHKAIDINIRALFQFQTHVRFFQLYSDIVSSFMLSMNALVIVLLRGWVSSEGAAISLALNISLLTVITILCRMIVDLDNYMASTQRVNEYDLLQAEGAYESDNSFVINRGKVEFKNVVMKYRKFLEPSLKDVSFIIPPSSKVGIVGRTGAGKSSLMQAIFRLSNLHSGEILIDDQNIASTGLHQLRKQISVIPQSPFLFSATIRDNLDPLHNHSDDDILDALTQVNLQGILTNLPNGLNTELKTANFTLSVGQKQLLCMARAIVRKNKVIMMDEATANVDPDTDQFIQITIREKFHECTLLIVAHRLRTVIDSDLIILMDNGKVAEFGNPANLAEDESSKFRKMINCTGKNEAKYLLGKIK